MSHVRSEKSNKNRYLLEKQYGRFVMMASDRKISNYYFDLAMGTYPKIGSSSISPINEPNTDIFIQKRGKKIIDDRYDSLLAKSKYIHANIRQIDTFLPFQNNWNARYVNESHRTTKQK